MELVVNILLGIIIAATPLVFAAIGELVVEKSGVLNLGVEGMMIVGAIAGFSVTIESENYLAGVVAALAAGALMALLFGFLTQTLFANQVATGWRSPCSASASPPCGGRTIRARPPAISRGSTCRC